MTWCREERANGAVVLTLSLHAQPGAKRTGFAGIHGDALKVRIAAPAVEGRANAELVRFIADAFGVPLRNVLLVRGEAGRDKVVRVTAPVKRPDREWRAVVSPQHSQDARSR